MDGGVNGDRNKGRDIEEGVKVTIRAVNGPSYGGGEEEQLRQGKRLYGTIKDRTVMVSLRKGPDLFRRAD
jgi:hypothetical protein